jgi:HprK-related kinase A
VIVSELPQQELARRLGNGGLRLRTGPVVNRIQSRVERVARGIALQYADYAVEDERGFADFHVRIARRPGLRRWVAPQAQFHFDGASPFLPLPADQAFPMLEWGLNWCVSSHCHQYLIVHAASVERSGCALLLPGAPGSGKSTLCAGLVARGWRLLSDELTLLELRTGEVMPLPRPVSLKNASIEAILSFSPHATVGPPVHDTVKGSVAHMKPPTESVRRANERARPRWIALPRFTRDSRASLTALSKARAFMHLADHAFNYDVHGRRGFELLTQVVSGCDCFEFEYGVLEDAVKVFDAAARRL